MKMILSVCLGVALASCSVRADEPTNPAVTVTGDDTNAIPLKELMATSSIVTNRAGIVLVKISPTLWAGKYEVTQKQYEKVVGANPSSFRGDDNPVDSVSWNDAVAFCTKSTQAEKAELPPGFGYSLPTETQWLYLVGNADLKDAVMKLVSEHNSTAPVGSTKPNNLGLYDMRGNVMEWCLDTINGSKVLRGGSWNTFEEPSSRIEFRNWAPAEEKKNTYGFRVLLEAVGQ